MELTPKQQTVELIKQAERILLVTGRNPNNDQLASMVALQLALNKMGKQVQAVMTDEKPKVASVIDTKAIAQSVTGVRDFVITLATHNVEVDKLKYNVEDKKLNITITPHSGNFSASDATFGYGAFQFDLVIAIGVPSFARLDKFIDEDPTLFDDLHVINLDYHRINESWGSVNLLDQMATCTSEMLVSTIESLEQGLVDEPIATALLAGIMAATNRFTDKNTTPKALTVAAQLMAAGARQQDIVKALYGSNGNSQSKESRNDEGSKKNPKNPSIMTSSQKKSPTTTTPPKPPVPSLVESTKTANIPAAVI